MEIVFAEDWLMRLRLSGAAALALWVLILVSAADAGWIWTSETGWMRKKYIPKATAREQYDHAAELHGKGEYEKAVVAFALVRDFYPDSEFIEEADFMQAECLFLLGRNVSAYKIFEGFLERYPDSKKRAAAIEREVEIGERLLGGAKKDWVGGVKLVRDREKGVDIIERAISHDPFHTRVPRALVLIGDSRFRTRWYSEAKQVYTRVAENYPKSDVRAEAEYRAVLADSRAAADVMYDTGACTAIEKKCRRLEAKNEGEMAKKAAELAEVIRSRRAEKDFLVAEFYRKAGKKTAALTCYRSIVKTFEGTEWAGKAKGFVAKLSGQ